MSDILYEFEEEAIPPVVVLSAATLGALFVLGFGYKLLSVFVL